MSLLIFCGIAFLLGSIPTGLLIAKYLMGMDIRTQGSGNIGMTNVMRVGGKWPGILTFVGDFGKGIIAVLLARWYFDEGDENMLILKWSSVGIAAICGHVFSIFLNFKGGKGIATTFGVLTCLSWPVGLGAALIWVGMFLMKRISSLAALVMLIFMPFFISC